MNDHAKAAIFWDKSYLWGLIAYWTFRRLAIDFELLTSHDIRTGALEGRDFDLLFVPGGWANDKIQALGEEGAVAIKSFVARGAGYLGFCGGAGLALSHDSGLGLAPFGRMPTDQRLPSFSGKIVLKQTEPSHPMWRGVDEGTPFFAWWPGQFALNEERDMVRVLATYGSPVPGSFVTDLPIGPGYDWSRWEELYGLNLDPQRITGQPAAIELDYGQGKVVLSYLHFETPEDQAGHVVLLNLIEHLSGKGPAQVPGREEVEAEGAGPGRPRSRTVEEALEFIQSAATARDLERKAYNFICFGQHNFLWYWRNSWLLQWRRGVKGIEYSTIYGMLAELARLAEKYNGDLEQRTDDEIAALKELVVPFFLDARDLIMAERLAMSQGPLSPLKSEDPEIRRLRERLFSVSKRCGGLYEEILDKTDAILLPLLIREAGEK